MLKLVLTGLCLAASIYILARFVHRYLYETMPEGLAWRGPLAGAIIWLISLAIPAGFNTWKGAQSWPISFNDLFVGDTQSAGDDLIFQEFRVPRPDGQFAIYRLDKVRRGVAMATVYVDENGGAIPAGTTKMTGITKDGQAIEFSALLDEQGNIDRGADGAAPARYRATDGRIMTSVDFGKLSRPSSRSLWIGFVLFVFQFLAWSACLVLLLEFRLLHGLVLGISCAALWVFILNFII